MKATQITYNKGLLMPVFTRKIKGKQMNRYIYMFQLGLINLYTAELNRPPLITVDNLDPQRML